VRPLRRDSRESRRRWWRLPIPVIAAAWALALIVGQQRASATEVPGTHAVQKGDTLTDIAAATGVPVDRLVELNDVEGPDRITAGQVLRLTAAPSSGRYYVQPGDTLSGVAAANSIPTAQLAALNALPDPDLLLAGQVLELPGADGRRLPPGVSAQLPSIRWMGSPNFWPGRPRGAPLALVLHTADGALAGIDATFASVASERSAHYGIALDGRVHQYVELMDRAWANGLLESGHAWPGPREPNPNHYTISIETEDLGTGQPVSEAQYQATLAVGRLVLTHYPSIQYVVTHRAISPESRHDDPGHRWVDKGRFATLASALGLKAIL